MIGYLLRDNLVRAAAALFAVYLAAFLFQIVPLQDFLDTYNYPLDLAWLLLILGSIWVGRRRIEKREERIFWGLIAAGLGAWAAVDLFMTLFPSYYEQHGYLGFWVDVLFLVYYGLFLAAAERNPDDPRSDDLVEPEVRLVGITIPTVVTVSLFVYLIFIPAIIHPPELESIRPSFMLFVVLDFILASRFLRLTRTALTLRWNTIFGLFALAFYVWGLVEGGQLITSTIPEEAGAQMPAVLNLVWFVAFPLMVAAIRLRHYQPPATPRFWRPGPMLPQEEVRRRYDWSLVSLAALLPIVHFLGYHLGLLDEATRSLRELTVMVYLLGVAVLSFTINRLRAALLRVREETEHSRRMETVGTLAGGIAHDFNNLMTVVMGNAQLLSRDGGSSDLQKRHAREILRAGERASDLAARLLAFSRRDRHEPEVLDLSEVLGEMEDFIQGVMSERVSVRMHVEHRLPLVYMDRGHLEQILLNLVTNARDAMPDGGELEIRADRLEIKDRGPGAEELRLAAGEYVALSVTDDGVGMDRTTLDRVFDPYFTTKPREKGTGLGLSTVYGLVAQNEGEIRAESRPGQGASFTIYIPRASERAGEPKVRERTTAPAGEGGRVLVVEDEESVRELVEELLTDAGYDVLTAPDGEEGLRVYREEGPFDLLLTDILMPRMTGVELAAQVRREQPDQRVMYMTGYSAQSALFPRDVDPGITLLKKPFQADDLLDRVRTEIDGAGT